MSDIVLVPYENNLKYVWDDVVQASKNGNFIHLRDYIEYHLHRFDERSLLVFKNEKPVAIFPCNKLNDNIISHSGLSYAGLICDKKLRSTDVLSILESIVKYYSSRDFVKIIYKAIPYVFHRYPADEDLYTLHHMGAKIWRRDISTVIKISNKIKLSDSKKNTIRKAERFGLEVYEGLFFDDFYEILTLTLAHHGATPTHNLDELKYLHSRFSQNIRLFGAFSTGNKLLAGSLIYDFGHIAHSQYLANSEEGKKVGALDLLLDYILKFEFDKHQYFSFGISTEQDGRCLNEGLIFHKESFGGRAVTHDFYELPL